MFLREALEPVELTKDQIVLKEKAHHLLAVVFWSMALFELVLDLRHMHDLTSIMVGGGACAYFLLFGLYGSVESTVCLSRTSGTLRIKRKLGWLTFEQGYSLNEVSRVFERKTLKGNGLRMQLLSGKKMSLTLFTEYSSLDAQAGAINHFIHGQARLSSVPGSSI